MERRKNTQKQNIFEPVHRDKFGIDIPFIFILRMTKDRFDCLIVYKSLKNFLVIIVFSSINSNHEFFKMRKKTCNFDFYLLFIERKFIYIRESKKLEVVFQNRYLQFFIEIFGIVQGNS